MNEFFFFFLRNTKFLSGIKLHRKAYRKKRDNIPKIVSSPPSNVWNTARCNKQVQLINVSKKEREDNPQLEKSQQIEHTTHNGRDKSKYTNNNICK